jgi:hypothetical protein
LSWRNQFSDQLTKTTNQIIFPYRLPEKRAQAKGLKRKNSYLQLLFKEIREENFFSHILK